MEPAQLATLIASKFHSQIFNKSIVDVRKFKGTISQNCDYLSNLVKNLGAAYPNNEVEIYSSQRQWVEKFGGADLCNNFTDYKLVYTNFDNTPNFDDWNE